VIIYLSACTTASLFWVVMGDGTVDDLKGYVETPGDALTREFWPIWAWLIWGTIVVAHAALVLGKFARIGGRRALPPGRPPSRGRSTHPRHRQPSTRSPHRNENRRRFVAAMFTDISGSTGLTQELGDETWVELLATHRSVVRATTAEFDGTEVATQGDGFFVRFDHPARAALCAIEIQRRLAVERQADPRIPAVRVGIHVGDAIQAADDDVLGHVVNVAARLLDVAAPGEIMVTEPVADHVDPGLLVDHGLADLKGVGQPRHILGIKWS
jgi:class 3 adenylate cyclase